MNPNLLALLVVGVVRCQSIPCPAPPTKGNQHSVLLPYRWSRLISSRPVPRQEYSSNIHFSRFFRTHRPSTKHANSIDHSYTTMHYPTTCSEEAPVIEQIKSQSI